MLSIIHIFNEDGNVEVKKIIKKITSLPKKIEKKSEPIIDKVNKLYDKYNLDDLTTT